MTTLCYDTDLSDAEWAILAPLLVPTTCRGRPRIHDLRRVLNAIFSILRGDEPWRLLPHEFPPWQSVYGHFRRWRQRGTWRSINDASRTQTRLLAGRSPEPHAAIIDSQTARTSEAGGERGYDGGKRISGRKRHLVVDTQGSILHVLVHPADQPAPQMPSGFAVLPQRWIVERTFAWLVRNRRLAKDWEGLPATTETWIYLAMSRLMIKRLAHAAA